MPHAAQARAGDLTLADCECSNLDYYVDKGDVMATLCVTCIALTYAASTFGWSARSSSWPYVLHPPVVKRFKSCFQHPASTSASFSALKHMSGQRKLHTMLFCKLLRAVLVLESADRHNLRSRQAVHHPHHVLCNQPRTADAPPAGG